MHKKHILITGGTGFLGTALIKHWLIKDYDITLLTRSANTATSLFGLSVHVVEHLDSLPKDSYFDAVVNLAGAPIFAKPWSQARKQLLRDSRIAFTHQLLSFLSQLHTKPEVLINGSAIGVYADENHSDSVSFSQQLCLDWEQAALQAEKMHMRVCLLRTGLVLGTGGGLLKNMLPAFKLGLGGQLGNGQQWMSWIHRDDWVAIVDELVNHSHWQGAIDATAPNPVTNSEFSRTLAKNLQRPCLVKTPAWILKLVLGEMSELVLASQRIIPSALLDAKFTFKFSDLASALQDVVGKH
ncbi:TIGR01777 family oxidoreductase [Methylomonas sp. AM2-LC]|uniref:TIGR01777 family oxidoreductase n=1 Tax=Methylomonas sp. AM2-LC TaxID=3153301 RepID=UPI003267C7EB